MTEVLALLPSESGGTGMARPSELPRPHVPLQREHTVGAQESAFG